jgi:hypothetical protein
MQVLGTLLLPSAGLAFVCEVPANLQEIYKSHKVVLTCLLNRVNGADMYRPLNAKTYFPKDLMMEMKAPPTWAIAAI